MTTLALPFQRFLPRQWVQVHKINTIFYIILFCIKINLFSNDTLLSRPNFFYFYFTYILISVYFLFTFTLHL